MAPVPKKKMTRGRSNRRRNAIGKHLSVPSLVTCPNCKKKKLSHIACPYCGFYR